MKRNILIAAAIIAALICGGWYWTTTNQSETVSLNEMPTTTTEEVVPTQTQTTVKQKPRFVTFEYPKEGTVLSFSQDTEIRAEITDPEIQATYPYDESYIFFGLYEEDGTYVRSVGDGYKMREGPVAWSLTSGSWQDSAAGLLTGKKYFIRAKLVYQPADVLCWTDEVSEDSTGKSCNPAYTAAQEALIVKADSLQSDSALFTFTR